MAKPKISMNGIIMTLLLLGVMIPPAIAPGILYDYLGLTLVTVGFLTWIYLVIVFWKTPALTFLSASLGKKLVIINPKENKLLTFKPSTLMGGLSYVKGQGYYIEDHDDIYIEEKSKVPVAMNYGTHSHSINPEMAEATGFLDSIGIKNHEQLKNLRKRMQEDIDKRYDEFVKKEEKKKGFDPTKLPPKPIPTITILGKSTPLDKVVNYFSTSDKSTDIESEINRRTAAQALAKTGLKSEALKWVVMLGIFMVCAAIAYVIILQAQPIIREVIKEAPKVVTGGAATQVT